MSKVNINLTGNEKPYAGCGLNRMFVSAELGANVWFNRSGDRYSVVISGPNGAIEKRLKNHLGDITTKNLYQKMAQAAAFLVQIGQEYACPVCGLSFSSSVEHIAGHARRGDSKNWEFSTSWETPNGASGINYWKFDKHCTTKKLRSIVIGAVADYRAEHIDEPARGAASLISAMFGRA